MNNKVLIFVTRYLCYASNEYFAIRLKNELEAKGFETEVCNIIGDVTAETELSKYIGKQYLAVIDFNSTMPRAMVGKERFLDLIDAPFFNYIVDHPLYHHPILNISLKNFHVICIDKLHKEYIEQHYPHIKGVHFQPLPGSRAKVNVPFERRKSGLLFAGTYYDLAKYEGMINDCKAEKRQQLINMVELLKASADITPENALNTLIKSGMEINAEEYARKLNDLYLADIYVRALNRKRVVDAFASTGIKLTICGNEWDKYNPPKGADIDFIEGVDFDESINVIASCKAMLNVLPGFRKGGHDRIFTAMLNRTVAVSDGNPYLAEALKDKGQLLYNMDNAEADVLKDNGALLYNIDSVETDASKVVDIIKDEKKLQEISQSGFEIACEKFTWKKLSENIILFLTQK